MYLKSERQKHLLYSSDHPKIYLELLFNDYLDFGEHSTPNISCNKVGMRKNQLMINVCFLGRSIGP